MDRPHVAPHRLTATEGVAAIRAGALTADAWLRDCLDRISTRDAAVRAFAWLDPEHALAEASERDRVAAERRGPLHGVPLGVKDIIDTHDMPTGYGSPIYAGHRPPHDAACVALAREAGAVVAGKTVTTEFALRHPGPTANPHDAAHTPGGSSSGSAAAVADFMVPVAFGTQTGGSIIRPASYCGVVGFKPSFGTINSTGVKPLANSFDTVGLFARSVDDCALVVDVLSGAASSMSAPEALRSRRPSRVGLCRTPAWPHAQPETIAAVQRAADALERAGVAVEDVELPPEFTVFGDAQTDVLRYEAARVFAFERTRRTGRLSQTALDELAAGMAVPRRRYLNAQALIGRSRQLFATTIGPYDCLLSASAPGEAPAGLHSTGEATFNRLTSGLGVPCINLPGFNGSNGLPVGIQLIGAMGDDTALLQVAGWMSRILDSLR